MPQLPSRTEVEQRFADAMAAGGTAQRALLMQHLGDPPDPRNVPQWVWKKIEDDQTKDLIVLLALIYLMSADNIDEWLRDQPALSGMPWYKREQVERLSQQYGRTRSRELSQQMTGTSIDRLKQASERLRKNIDPLRPGPENVVAYRDGVYETLNKITAPERAMTAAITEVTAATTAAESWFVKWVYDYSDYVLLATWEHRAPYSAEGPGHPCPICEPLIGKTQNEWAAINEDAVTGPPLHPNCLLPDAQVVGVGEIAGASKAFYRGTVVEVVLANGRVLSCTENHPILTPQGWVKAGMLHEGVNVLCSADRNGSASFGPNDHNVPPTIEQAFCSLEESGAMMPRRVPVSTEDFDGDARMFDGKVDVVYSDSFLRSRANRKFQKVVGEHRLQGGLAMLQSLIRLGSTDLFLRRMHAILGCLMGGQDLLLPCMRGHATPVKFPSFAHAAHWNATITKGSRYSRSRHAKLFTERVSRFTSNISRDQFLGNVSSRPSTPVQSTGIESGAIHFRVQGRGGNRERFRDFCNRLSSQLSVSHVVQVNHRGYAGHVYDLHCPEYNLFAANGIIVANCDCWNSYELITKDEAMNLPTVFPTVASKTLRLHL